MGERGTGHGTDGGRSDGTDGAAEGVCAPRIGLLALPLIALPTAAHAQAPAHSAPATSASAWLGLDTADLSLLPLVLQLGLLAASLFALVLLMRARRHTLEARDALVAENATLRADLARAEALIDAGDERYVIWSAGAERPHTRGRLGAGVPHERAAFLAFGTWMTPEAAAAFERALAALRDEAETFDLTVETQGHAVLEAQGRISGAHAFVRFVELTGTRAALAKLELDHARVSAEFDALSVLFEQMDAPAWMRDADGRLIMVNRAYAHAVEGSGIDSVRRHGTPLLDRAHREAAERHHAETIADSPVRTSVWRRRVPVTVTGERRAMDVTEVRAAGGTVGFAVDASEVEALRASFDATLAAHVRTLDSLAAAVATFDEHDRLSFHNQAFLGLWGLEARDVEDIDHASLLERLRALGRIPEQANFREWRNRMSAVHRGTDTLEDRWTLPDGRTVRVVATPEAKGGATWVFENVTEQFELETAFRELTRVRGETLDHLSEAVAVFGADGRLKLSNPAFGTLWDLPEPLRRPEAPLAAIAALLREATGEGALWDELVPAVTGMGERLERSGRFEVRREADGADTGHRVVDWALVPLPDGQTMFTFVDVTASVRAERMLQERNEALLAGERLKNSFMRHVSIAFRAPLQSVKGFAEMLSAGLAGPLEARQADYVTHIETSAATLEKLVDNTMDLSAMQAGLLTLTLEEADAGDVMRAAADEVAGLLAARDVSLDLRIADDLGSAVMDAGRVRQVVANLLANAARFSPAGGRVVLDCRGRGEEIEFSVSDEGPGVAADRRDAIFGEFEAGAEGGAGLGLAIAKSVLDLHGGRLQLAPAGDSGATFVSHLPRRPHDAAANEPDGRGEARNEPGDEPQDEPQDEPRAGEPQTGEAA